MIYLIVTDKRVILRTCYLSKIGRPAAEAGGGGQWRWADDSHVSQGQEDMQPGLAAWQQTGVLVEGHGREQVARQA